MLNKRPDPWGRHEGHRRIPFRVHVGGRRRERRLRLFAAAAVALGVGLGLLLPRDLIPGLRGRPQLAAPPPIYNPDPPRKRRQDEPILPPAEVAEQRADAPAEQAAAVSFGFCAGRTGDNCVIDGDTFIVGGETVRLAGIDTAELGGAQCDAELALAKAAEQRLHQLLNSGQMSLTRVGFRDRDRYGRLLRDAVVDGRSVSDQLMAEGLAREWRGQKESWCDG